MTIFDETITETVNISTALPVGITTALTDELTALGFVEFVYARSVDVTEGLNLSEVVAPAWGVEIAEHLLLGLSAIDNYHSQVSLVETLTTLDQLAAAFPITISETLSLSLTQVAQQAIEVIEELGLSDTLLPMLTYNMSVTETISLSASLARFFGAEIVEALNLSDVMISSALHPAELIETLTVTEAASPQLVLRVEVTDELTLSDDTLLNMIFSGEITEELQLTIGYLSPGDGISTWVMNTRTAAVTEYSNYAFNSFAKIGDRYLGASENGLYELTGDDDDGTDIIAHIQSGFAQWAGSRFTMFKAVYLGLRGEGDFVLKVTTGDDKTYIYGVNARDMRTTKVHVGKGLRARYFAFELISTGQDFDLDTIEFAPLVAERRV